MQTSLVLLLILAIAGLVLIIFIALTRQWFFGKTTPKAFGLLAGLGTVILIPKMIAMGLWQLPTPQSGRIEPRHHIDRNLTINNDIPSYFASNRNPASQYQWQALPAIAPHPENNPPTPEKIQLGEKLFLDKRLSRDNTVACVSCHQLTQEFGGADGLAVSIGIDNQAGSRNTPTVLNTAFQQVLFWDGRASSLEEQAKGPLINPLEMGMPSLKAVEEKVQQLPEYQILFKKAFPDIKAISIDEIAQAIASFERTLITPSSPYDRFVSGDKDALTKQQQYGMALFESVGCIACHSGPNFSAASIFDTPAMYRSFPAIKNPLFEEKYQLLQDLGLAEGNSQFKKGVWRVPSLRNVSLTAPYFHNGSVKSLKEAVRIMANMQLNKKVTHTNNTANQYYWSNNTKQFSQDNHAYLSDDDIDSLVSFLEGLSGDIPNTEQVDERRLVGNPL